MAGKTNKKKVDAYCEFKNVNFPCTVECVSQPNRIEVLEGEQYFCVDKCHNNLVILDSKGRELLFDKKWFVLVS
jgi:hypothetical protein